MNGDTSGLLRFFLDRVTPCEEGRGEIIAVGAVSEENVRKQWRVPWESLPGPGKLRDPEQVVLLTVQICTGNNIFRSLEILEIMGW